MCGAKRRIWSIILARRKLSILSKNLKALVRFTKIDFFFNCFRVFWERTRRQSCRKDKRYRMACAVNGQRQMVILLTIALVWFLIIIGCHVEIWSSLSEENFLCSCIHLLDRIWDASSRSMNSNWGHGESKISRVISKCYCVTKYSIIFLDGIWSSWWKKP